MLREDTMKYPSSKFNLLNIFGNIFRAKTKIKCRDVKYIEVKLMNAKGYIKLVSSEKIKKGNIILVEKGDIIPEEGIVIDGTAWVDESPITGESAPVLKDVKDENNSVIKNTKVICNWLKIEVTAIK